MAREIMKTFCLVLCLLSVTGLCRADRDIVYAARYYAPPGSHRTSHFHIYRINPNGTGKTQLTFGSGNEGEPHWSVDGRRVTYIERSLTSVVDTVCEIDADGGNRHVVKTLTDIENWENLVASGYRLENTEGDYDKVPNRHVLIDLKTGQEQTLPVPAHDDSNDELVPMPGNDLVYAANNHDSFVGTDYYFYRLNPSTGTLHCLTEGQFLAWSPDGMRFCIAPGRDTTPYEKRKKPYPAQYFDWPDAAYRMVWYAPLYVRAAAGGPMRQITPRLSYVSGADWRKGR